MRRLSANVNASCTAARVFRGSTQMITPISASTLTSSSALYSASFTVGGGGGASGVAATSSGASSYIHSSPSYSAMSSSCKKATRSSCATESADGSTSSTIRGTRQRRRGASMMPLSTTSGSCIPRAAMMNGSVVTSSATRTPTTTSAAMGSCDANGTTAAAAAAAGVVGPACSPRSVRRRSPAEKRRRANGRKKTTAFADILESAETEASEVAASSTATVKPRKPSKTQKEASGQVSKDVHQTACSSIGSLPTSPVVTTTKHTGTELRDHLTVSALLQRLYELGKVCATSLLGVPNHRGNSRQRQRERLLALAIQQSSFEAYANLSTEMEQLYADKLSGNYRDVNFLRLYARVLINEGTFCLVNFESHRAIELLQQAISMTYEMYAAAAQTDGNHKRNMELCGLTAAGDAGALPAMLLLQGTPDSRESAEAACAYARVLLGTAYSCEAQHWEAARQLQAAADVLARYPLGLRPQLCPGPHGAQQLSPDFLAEEVCVFSANKSRVEAAISQGRAQLLLMQSQVAQKERELGAQLALARLYREARQYRESQARYEVYIDGLVLASLEDKQFVALELGRMLCFEAGKPDAGLVYLEAAGEMLCEDAEEFLAAQEVAASVASASAAMAESGDADAEAGTTARRSSTADSNHDALARSVCVRAACALLDTAIVLHDMGKTGKALGLLEESLSLLQRAGLESTSAWIRLQYADMLAASSFVDRAIAQYDEAAEVLRDLMNTVVATNGDDGADAVMGTAKGTSKNDQFAALWRVKQFGRCQRTVMLHVSEAEAHLAFCLQTYVGDYRRAMRHYEKVFAHTVGSRRGGGDDGRRAGAAEDKENLTETAKVRSEDADQQHQQQQQHTSTSGEAAVTAVEGWRCRVTTHSHNDVVGSGLVNPDTVHWALSNYVACAERIGDWPAAVGAQEHLMQIESSVGVSAADMIPSYLKLAELFNHSGDLENELSLYFHLFFLPEGVMPTVTQVLVAQGFAKCCYLLGDQRMGAILINSVQRVGGDYDPLTIVDYALRLSRLSPTQLRAGIESIANVFLRAARLTVASRAVDAADGRPSDGTQELSTLIALNRGAFFFQHNGFTKEAEDLYYTALSIADEYDAKTAVAACASSTTLSTSASGEGAKVEGAQMSSEVAVPSLAQVGAPVSEYNREFSVLLANYATLISQSNRSAAQQMYERAADLNPECRTIAEVVADFFVQSGNYAKGSAYMRRVMAVNPEVGVDMHTKIAHLGVGPAWAGMTYEGRLEVMEHLLLGLGIAKTRLPAWDDDKEGDTAMDAQAFEVHMSKLRPLLLDGVATSRSSDAVSLATFIVQTKFSYPRLLNDMYKHAVRDYPGCAAILVNYAKMCCDMGCTELARKYYAKAYALEGGDFCRTQWYSSFLYCSFKDQQGWCGEALYRYHLERNPNSAEACAHYANYLACVMPSPIVTERYFEKALTLDPKSEVTYCFYADFVWAAADSQSAHADTWVKSQIFDKAERLFSELTRLSPENAHAWHRLGSFYASRTNRFEDAITALQKAHRLAPENLDILRKMCAVLVEECVRAMKEEQDSAGRIAKQGMAAATATPKMSKRIEAIAEGAQQAFEAALRVAPSSTQTLEEYAVFAAKVLHDPKLASELWGRLRRLGDEQKE